MITEEMLLSKETVFSGDFTGRESVFREFDATDDPKYHLLYALYECECYSGTAVVLGFDYEKKQFFEVAGYHCSCYGLEGQWEPEYFDNLQLLILVLQKRDWQDEPVFAQLFQSFFNN